MYQVLPDPAAAQEGQVRVIDESGEDYLYSAEYFVAVKLELGEPIPEPSSPVDYVEVAAQGQAPIGKGQPGVETRLDAASLRHNTSTAGGRTPYCLPEPQSPESNICRTSHSPS